MYYIFLKMDRQLTLPQFYQIDWRDHVFPRILELVEKSDNDVIQDDVTDDTDDVITPPDEDLRQKRVSMSELRMTVDYTRYSDRHTFRHILFQKQFRTV